MGFFQNTCRPEGLGGKIMVTTMNMGGHAALAKWEKMIQGMKIYQEDELIRCLKEAGFLDVTVHRNREKHWICFIAEK